MIVLILLNTTYLECYLGCRLKYYIECFMGCYIGCYILKCYLKQQSIFLTVLKNQHKNQPQK